MNSAILTEGTTALTDTSVPETEHQESLLETAAANSTVSNKRMRLFGLLLVLSVAFGSFLLASFFTFFGTQFQDAGGFATYRYVNSAAIEIVALALLLYVLRQNGSKPADIGFVFQWRDVRSGILLILGAGFVYYVAAIGFFRAYQAATRHTAAPPSIPGIGIISFWLLAFVLINPFFEELIVRAYMISEITTLTGSGTLAVLASVLLQTSYHLYQGIPFALAAGVMFLVFSLYYVRTRRIWPVILAHLWFDFSAIILYPMMNARR